MSGNCTNDNIAPTDNEEEHKLVPGQDADHIMLREDANHTAVRCMSDDSEFTETLSSEFRSDVTSGTLCG